MKNIKSKKFLVILMITSILSMIFLGSVNHVEAKRTTSWAIPYLNKADDKFNAADVLHFSAESMYDPITDDVNHDDYPVIATTISEEMISNKTAIQIVPEGQGLEKQEYNGKKIYSFDTIDATNILSIESISGVIGDTDVFQIAKSICKELDGVTMDDVIITYTVELPELNEGSVNVKQSSISYQVINGKNQLTQQQIEQYQKQVKEYSDKVLTVVRSIHEKNGTLESFESSNGAKDGPDVVRISAKATIGGTSEYKGSEYKLVIGGNDSYVNSWCLVRTKEPEQKEEFKTTLEYKSEPTGKLSDGTYLPPYYDNDDTRKDVDATAIIKSITDEDIKSTNGVDLTVDGKPNSEGWYYSDVNNKKVIQKDYPFDSYDNTKDNGMVKETVKILGAEGGEDSQTPSIKWTFRRKQKEEKQNPDGSITVTITYNLPVDKDSIPNDWSPVYDEDGETIHKIKRDIKKGENYDKDVPVTQNGTDATVVTHVQKEWEKAPIIPQAGNALTIVLAAIIVIAGIAVVSYRKYRA